MASAGRPVTIQLLLLGCAMADAHAQKGPASRALPSCDGRIVRSIRATPQRPPFSGHSDYWRRAARTLGLHHATTDSVVIRQFLVLHVGEPCTQFRMRESERLLRAQPFLADASVRAVPDSSGGVRIEVVTVDEIPAIGALSLSGTHWNSAEIGNGNLLGQAWLLSVRASRSELEGHAGGVQVSDFQFLDRPYILNMAGDFAQRARAWEISAGHPYLTDLQRVAWVIGAARSDPSFLLVHRGEDVPDVALGFHAFAADIGGVLRLGDMRRPILLGGAAVVTQVDPARSLVLTDSGVATDTTLARHFESVRHSRLLGIAAWRNLSYVTVRGFDALIAAQDVATGVQILGQAGPGVRVLNSPADFFSLGDVYGGRGHETLFGAAHVLVEGRRDLDRAAWDGIVGSARAALYWKPTPLDLVRIWADGAGGWSVLSPFQIGLTTDDTRLGGFRASLLGSSRAGGGIEVRRVLGQVRNSAAFGVSVFGEAAKLWAGDAPFGVNTPVLASFGFGLLAAVPPASKRLVRLDVAIPLHANFPRTGVEFRFSFLDRTAIVREETGDVTAGRERFIGPNIFAP